MNRISLDRLLKARILLVEDEHFMRHLLIQALNSVGFLYIDEAENGRNALKSLEARGADIVITDIEMKPVNGLELVRAIRSGATPLRRETPVLFLSGLSDVSTLSSSSQLDVQGFMVKPVSANLLLEKVREALEKRVTLHPPAFYEAVRLDTASEPTAGHHANGTRREPTAEAPGTAGPQAARSGGDAQTLLVDLLMLEEGMTLCEDVKVHGTTLLKNGTVLMTRHINVLQDLRGVLEKRQFAVAQTDSAP